MLPAATPCPLLNRVLSPPARARWRPPGPPRARAPPIIIYDITDRRSGKDYVGITEATISDRIRRHIYESRRDQPRDPRGLLHQLRERVHSEQDFYEQFEVRELTRTYSLATAGWLEQVWIDRIGSMAPHGYNLMPGGASVGGRGNAQTLMLHIDGEEVAFTTIRAAVVHCNNRAVRLGAGLLRIGTVYARLVAGWSPEQACDLEPHDDGRSQRDPFVVDGRTYTSLAAASAATGVHMETLRSRLHRARRAGEQRPDIGRNRRRGGRRPMLGLRHPETGEVVSARTYSRATGIPAATVLSRFHRAGDNDPRCLAVPVERRKQVGLRLPCGRVLTGGYRQTAARVVSDPDLQALRCEELSQAGIRARLKRMTTAQRSDPDFVYWACGMLPNGLTYDEMSHWHLRKCLASRGSIARRARRKAIRSK